MTITQMAWLNGVNGAGRPGCDDQKINKQELLRTCDDLQFIIMNEVNLKENEMTINDVICNSRKEKGLKPHF